MIGWNHPDTAHYYEAFCDAHPRYRAANESLAWHADIAHDHRVLDVGAGIGHTTEAILPWLSDAGRVIAFEPAEAMRRAGQTRVRDPRVLWVDALPEGPFDRILCGASIWQMLPLEDTLQQLANLLARDGALSFNIPSLYLGEPDDPGGGDDPHLFALPARLGATNCATRADPLPTPERISTILIQCGLHVTPWRFRQTLTQDAYRDWLKIPILTNQWFADLGAAERSRRIDSAFQNVERNSWRWEAWSGWTARRTEAGHPEAPSAHQPLTASENLPPSDFADRAESDGYLYFRGLLDPRPVEALRSRVEELHQRLPAPPGAAHDDPRFLELQRSVALLPEWDALRRHPAILDTLGSILGAAVDCQCGDVCRVVPPGAPTTATPPHQDGFFLRQPGRIWTVWIPLGDCPLRLGPLAVLPGSSRKGLQPHFENQIVDVQSSGWWAASSMRSGDVLMFGSLTVHRACPNLTRDTIRFSADFRYAGR